MRHRENGASTAVRLTDAFWTLAKDHEIDRMTVKMIVEEAGCSKGSFYYHFEDVSALAFQAVKTELLMSGSIPRHLYAILMGQHELARANENDFHSKRIELVVSDKVSDAVSKAIDGAILEIWNHLLSEDGEPLNDDTLRIISFFMAGMKRTLGTSLFLHNSAECKEFFESSFVRETFVSTMKQACRAQNVAPEKCVERLGRLRDFGWVPPHVI